MNLKRRRWRAVGSRAGWAVALCVAFAVGLLLAGCNDEDLTALASGTKGRVLVMTPAGIAPEVTGYVGTFGYPGVDHFDLTTGTPSLDTLRQYRAVFITSSLQPNDQVALGNNLADYLDLGGGLVLGSWGHTSTWGVQGRFATGGYSPFTSNGTNANTGISLGTVYLPGHPLMAGVTTLGSTNNDDPALRPGGILVADWNNTVPAIAVSPSGRVVGITTYLTSGGSTGDYQRLAANAIGFVMSH